MRKQEADDFVTHAYTVVFLIPLAARPFDLQRSSLGLFRLPGFLTLTFLA